MDVIVVFIAFLCGVLIGLLLAAGIADADTGAPGANEVSVNILYR